MKRHHGYPLFFLFTICSPLLSEFAGAPGRLNTNSNPDDAYFELAPEYPSRLATWVSLNAPLTKYARKFDDALNQPLLAGGDEYMISERVLVTEQGTMFITDQFTESCSPHGSIEEVRSATESFISDFRGLGVEVYVAVSPNKSSLRRELVPRSYPLFGCSTTYSEQLWASILPIEGVIDLISPLKDFEDATGVSTFKKEDTHWNQGGAAAAVGQILKTLDHRNVLEQPIPEITGIVPYEGDLRALGGLDSYADLTVSATLSPTPTVETFSQALESDGFPGNRTVTNKSADAQLGKLVIFGDSFSQVAETFISPFFEEVTFQRLYDFDTEKYSSLIEAADYVLFWSVERSFVWRLMNQWSTLPSIYEEQR